MFKRILVPLDGSEMAEQVLPYIEELARALGSQIILLHVPIYAYESVGDRASVYGYATLIAPEERAEALRLAIAYLKTARQKLVTRGLNVWTTVQDGLVGETILQVAREREVDLIAMATHGRTGIARAFYGSVAEQVVHAASVPVLLLCVTKPPAAAGVIITSELLERTAALMHIEPS